MTTPLAEGPAPAGATGPSPEAIASLWAEVLELPAAGPDDDFFELGGDSLSAVQVLSRLQGRFGVRLSLAAFFAHPTPAGVARLLGEQKPETRNPKPETNAGSDFASRVSDLPRRDRFPATSSQARLWFLDQFIPDRQAYNVHRLVRVQ